MKVLFVMQHSGYVRNYEPVIVELAKRGHEVHLAFNASKDKDSSQNEGILSGALEASPNIICEKNLLPRRTDKWADFAIFIRTLRDCMRYLTPKYTDAHDLRERIFNRFQRSCGRIGRIVQISRCLYLYRRLTGRWGVGALSRLMQIFERVVPVDPTIHGYLRDAKPDILLVTPLLDFASQQADYLKSAKVLGIRSALCVHSWDNLTNKGLIHVQPDRVILWNEAQKREAITMHGTPAESVAITGAQCYDKWFERKPSRTREAFLRETGLPADATQVVTYLCSSPFIAPDEVGFVMRWLQVVRGNEQVKGAAILIRPHPQNAGQWSDVDLSAMGSAAVWPRAGANPINDQAKNDFYDSMYYADAVVGINTSAMIESGTLGKTVLTVLDGAFKGTQEGTLHFHHLVKGGLLKVSRDLPEHVRQLCETLNDSAASSQRVREFIGHFVRPHGLDVPCAPIVADAIEALAKVP